MKKISFVLTFIFLVVGCFNKNLLIGDWELENKQAANSIREYSFTNNEMIDSSGITPVIKYEVNKDDVKVFIADSDPIIFMIKDKNKICAMTPSALLLPEGDNCYVRVNR